MVESKRSSALRERLFAATQWLPRLVARVPATVHAKLLVAFLAIVVLLITLGAVGLQVLTGVNRRAEELVKRHETIAAYRQFQHDTSLPPSWSWNQRTLEATLGQLKQFGYELDQLQVAAVDDAEPLARVRENYDHFIEVVGQIVELLNARNVAEGRKLQLTQAGPLADQLERFTNDLMNKAELDLAASTDASQAAYIKSRWIVIGFAVGSIGLALVLGYAISWSLIGPVKQMDSRLRLVASGDLSQRVEVPNRDELGDLAEQFNRMAGQLQESHAEQEERTRQVTEALEQQTATSEILGVISRSHTDVQPVFGTIAAAATNLCAAENAGVFLFDGTLIHFAAHYHWTAKDLDAIREVFPRPPGPETVTARAILTRAVAHTVDIAAEPGYELRGFVEQGFRTILSVPMLRDGEPIGAISVTRREAVPFTDKQIALLKTFADQAVIAVENVRLFKELEARTGELTRSVEQLTALGEVSQAVSSTLDVETVLDTIVSRASQLAGADACGIYEYDEDAQMFHVRATHNFDAAFVARLRAMPLHKGEGASGRATEAHEPIQIADITAPGAYESRVRDLLIGSGYRAVLSVPLLREEQIIGSLTLVRRVPGEYSPEVIEVLKTFATQSALAIQNARLFREIADKSRQLETASRHKSEFLANMSHELRTPLNAIIGFSEVLVDRMFGELNEKQDEYLKDIYASGQHLLSLINDILDLSKIEAGRMELEATDFDLPSAIDNALTLVRERASRRGIALAHTIDEHLGMLRGDERKVKQVLLNLLSNALKFTPEGGRIDVSARVHDEVAEIAVTDTGVGIAPDDQEAVFEEFRQVGAADKKVEGTGLGLALARKFIELHGGRIWVKSEPGTGSTFTFTLPLTIDQRRP
jgi:signal transduction histidine kinase/HAMP domain-containing protein